jgi:PAS domain S-box-containing protein
VSYSRIVGTQFLDYVLPSHRNSCERSLLQTLNSGERRTCELELNREAADKRVVRIESTPAVSKTDESVTCRVVLIDISDRVQIHQRLKQAYEQLEMAARAADLGVWNYDLANGTAQWNEQLYRLLGLEPREGTEDKQRFFEFIHPEDRSGIIANLQALLKQKKDEIQEEFRVIRADGKIRWLAARGRIYRDERERAVRISGINYDITDRKQSEETIRLAQFQLATQLTETESVNEELSQYAYAVSHDLKAPLRAIRNYAEFLYEDLAGSLTGEQKKYLEGLKTAVEQGDELINDLLSFSRIGRDALEAEEADVPAVVEEIRSGLDLPSDVEFIVQSRWPKFTVDRALLKQILQNLITNAVKFNESDPKRIEIDWQAAPNDFIEIVFRDNGIGIEPRYRKQIFRIFQRLHTDRDYAGTGIGLAIVRKAAQMLGGIVRIESEPGKGSTFFVQLPREMSDRPEASE